MRKGFFAILGSHFFSSLADNTLLIVALGFLISMDAPAWSTPLLKFVFFFSYVILAPFVGHFADRFPKNYVMFVANSVKFIGCVGLGIQSVLSASTPNQWLLTLLLYGIVGFGAATYSPAKYGILTELLEPKQLVVANGWLETLTVLSIILGAILGGLLVDDKLFSHTSVVHYINLHTLSIFCVAVMYVIAAIINIFIPQTGVVYQKIPFVLSVLVKDFSTCMGKLWTDKLGQLTLASTTIVWGSGATLQFVLLAWAAERLHLSLSQASMLQGVVGIGMVIGAILAGRFVSLAKTPHVVPYGVLLGYLLLCMNWIDSLSMAIVLVTIIGIAAGFFVVAMNALLQHRGLCLMGAGHSIAVQNFNEHISVLGMICLYSLLLKFNTSVTNVINIFAATLVVLFAAIAARYAYNKKNHRLDKLILDAHPISAL